MVWYWVINMIFPQPQNTGIDILSSIPIPILIVLIFTVAITEEILFKAYPIERISDLLGNKWIAVVISFVIFVYPHIQFMGLSWLLYHGIGAILTYILYVWKKNLVACMLLHLLLDLPILIPALGFSNL